MNRLETADTTPTKESMKLKLLAMTIGFIAVSLLFGLLEVGLRIIDFKWSSIPQDVSTPFSHDYIDDMNRRSQRKIFQKDNELFWKMVPGSKIGRLMVNEQGFFGSLAPDEKEPQDKLIGCFGDSCTALGLFPYPQRLQRDLELAGLHNFIVLNRGVPGYSSLQGLRLIKREMAMRTFDVITIYYGWNDHWRALSKPDRAFATHPVEVSRLQNILAQLRVYQCMVYLLKEKLGKLSSEQSEFETPRTTQNTVRVPIRDFQQNLRNMVELIINAGVTPMMITAPMNAEALAQRGYPHGDDNVLVHEAQEVILHRNYIEVVRGVAARYHIPLIDLAAEFDQRSETTSFLFMKDGIHLGPVGEQLASDALFTAIQEKYHLEPKLFETVKKKRTFTSLEPHFMSAKLAVEPRAITGQSRTETTLTVTCINSGDTSWEHRSTLDFGYVTIGISLYDTQRRKIKRDFGRIRLKRNVQPGESVTMSGNVTLPEEPGNYFLAIDMVLEGMGWFEKWGGSPLFVPLTVKSAN